MKADDFLDHLAARYGPNPELQRWLRPLLRRLLRLRAHAETRDALLLLAVDVYERDVRVRRRTQALRAMLEERRRRAIGRQLGIEPPGQPRSRRSSPSSS